MLTKKQMKRAILTAVAAAGIILPNVPAFGACFIFLHGHRDHNTTYQEAKNYWYKDNWWPVSDTNMLSTISANNKYTVVSWNSLVYYWDAAKEVAGKLNTILNGGNDAGGANCGSETSKIVVAHSMGGVVMDYIMGNSRTTDPYYNYGGANFANVAAKTYRVVTVQSPHNGTESANAVCGAASWACNTIAYFVASCDSGTASLQTASSWTVSSYANSPKVVTRLIGGYEALPSSGCLSGEDDGVVNHSGAFACSGSGTASYSTTNVCTSKQEASNFINGDQSHEDHDDGRNDNDRDVRKSTSGGWWSVSGSGSQVRSSMSNAEVIRCLFAYKPSGDTSCN
jgi:hypothetical protein